MWKCENGKVLKLFQGRRLLIAYAESYRISISLNPQFIVASAEEIKRTITFKIF